MAKMSSILEAFIGAMVAVVVGLAFLPTIFTSTTAVTSNANYTSNSHLSSVLSITYLLPLIFVIIVLVGAVSFIMWKRE
jgi:NADH:ubiquinone oxidoreductase subunit 6 (subunit J)